ncbi:hypothetical protein KL921_002789 [Ogataea angusta]|uniref:non-specific serine/threonine protein kinase n=1 Tax=Pichia angusta TaxID=870730 RepID=A0ABQ7RYG3_PICAN|nr:hypothetical protein KL921_002789 [Ogataea angusta]KAG7850135.1 hypothetical protein KL940_002503 [Ogataea angusta]
MVSCLRIVKLVGIGSLGLATSSFGLAAYNAVPDLINSTKLSILDSRELRNRFRGLLVQVRSILAVFGTAASVLFSMAYTRSPVTGKHPYLVYAALGAPLCAAYYCYGVLPLELQIFRSPQKRDPGALPAKTSKTDDLTSPLDNSVYNDLGTESDAVREEPAEDEQFQELELKTETIARLQALKLGYSYSISGIFIYMTSTVLSDKVDSQLKLLSHDLQATMDEYLAYEKGSYLKNKYKFLSNLQNGSFGQVTCALNMVDNTKVAVKALKKTIPGISFMARHEISIMRKLGYHPNVCQLLESFETKKYIVLVLEYVPGGDLYDAIHTQSPLGVEYQTNPQMFLSLVNQLADVMRYAYSRGVYHRDIKPENVLLMRDGSIKLCDWGLATYAGKCRDFNVGTEKYMAPEALRQKGEWYDAKGADSWSLAITLLFTLFGKCPFRKADTNDVNYVNFLKSKEFLYDYYPSINEVSFRAIVECFMVERDLDGGLELLRREGPTKGFTLDQEYKLELTRRQQEFAVQSDPAVASVRDDDVLGGEFFMFDTEPEYRVEMLEDQKQASYVGAPLRAVDIRPIPDSVGTAYSIFDTQAPPSLTFSYETNDGLVGSWCDEFDEMCGMKHTR